MSNNNTYANTASAAAMDALNLDDLFNCDDDDPNDSLFDDMDIDLGDISGVFHDEGGDVMNLEFGRMDSVGSVQRGSGASSGAAASQGKKRGSKVALTHAQIVAKLGIKSDSEKPAPAENETPSHRIRTRREAQQRSSSVEAEASNASGGSKGSGVHAPAMKEEREEVVSREMQDAMDSVAKFGLGASMQFYPYMKLPVEVEVKKGQKTFPCLEKVNHSSAPEKDCKKSKDTPPSHNETRLHQLFTSHLGSLIDTHGVHHTSTELDKTLGASVSIAKGYLDKNHPMFESLKGELAKLLVGCMKQGAFLRQNLWNMEAHARKTMNKPDFKSCFPVRRRDVEGVLSSVNREGLSALLPASASSSTPAALPTTIVEKEKDDSPTENAIPDSKPMISVRVKVRVPGWRDKSGRKLVARFKPPKQWKVATKRAKALAAKPQADEAASIGASSASLPPPPAVPKKPVNPAILEAAAIEILQSHMIQQSDVLSEKKKVEATTKPPSDAAKSNESPETTKKAPTRKRKLKESSAQSSSSVSAATRSPAECTPTTQYFDSFHIPSYKPLHSAILEPAPPPSKILDEHSLTRAQQMRIVQVLYTKILHPSLSPTERRSLLAYEISSAVQRLDNARTAKRMAAAQEIRKEIQALEAIYQKDLETVPETANTAGLWHWIDETSYFREIKKEDVYEVLDSVVVASLDMDDGLYGDDGKLWGSLLPPVNVYKAQDCGSEDETPNAVEESPLFDCLQSLLVEIDGSDEDSDDDDELLANLPPFTVEQLIHGPDYVESSSDDEAVLDVSNLSLEQRTFIQLRAAGLIDSSVSPSKPPCLVEEDVSLRKRPPLAGTSVDGVIERMKADLAKCQSEATTAASELERVALAHVSQSSTRKRKEREQETILTKYNDLLETQKEQREKKVRVSGRVKTGPNKFADWLPW